MVTAWQQDRRRKQAAQLKSESVAGLEALLSGVGGIADEQQRQTKEATAAEERKRKAAMDEAEAARKVAADADLAENRKALREDRASREAERVLRQKGEADKQSQVLRQKAKADALEGLKQRAAGGLDEEGLRRVAMNDEALGELDDDAVRAVMLEAQGEEKMKQAKEGEVQAKADAAAALAEQRRAPKPGPRPMSQTAKELSDAKLRKAKAEADIAERTARGGAGSGVKPDKPALTPAEVEGVVELKGARALIDRLGKMKTEGDIDTGPIANAIDWTRSKIGVGDPKRVEFKALIGTQIAEYIKSISGATVSEPERANLLQNVPTAGDNDEAFMAKLATVKSLIDTKLKTKREAFAATGRQTAIFDDAPAAPAKKPSEMTDEEIAARLAQLRGAK
jgi:hypothetical protein